MKKIIKIYFILCCLAFICACAKIDDFTGNKLFEEEKSISEELEAALEDNRFNNFSFQSGERAICVYEGIISFEIEAYKFAIYKETMEKDILFQNVLFIEIDTGDIYTWGGEELEKLILIDTFNMDEFERADISGKGINVDMTYKSSEADSLMNNIMAVLAQNENHDLKLIYEGTVDLINKKYFGVSLVEDFEDHIVRDRNYYLDVESGNLYEGKEESNFLRTELYYIGNIG